MPNHMKESDDLNITLRLGRQTMSININRKDEEAYRAAEKLINQRYNTYATLYPDQGNEIYLCMAALDIALNYKQTQMRNDTRPYTESIQQMLSTLDDALGNHRP